MNDALIGSLSSLLRQLHKVFSRNSPNEPYALVQSDPLWWRYLTMIARFNRCLPEEHQKLSDPLGNLFTHIMSEDPAEKQAAPPDRCGLHKLRFLLAWAHLRNHSADGVEVAINSFKTTHADTLWSKHFPGPSQSPPSDELIYDYLWLLVDLWQIREDHEAFHRLRDYLDAYLNRTPYHIVCKTHRLAGFFAVGADQYSRVAEDIVLQHLYRINYLHSALASDAWHLFEQLYLYLCFSSAERIFPYIATLLKLHVEKELMQGSGHIRPMDTETHLRKTSVLLQHLVCYSQYRKLDSNETMPLKPFALHTGDIAEVTGGEILPPSGEIRRFSMVTYILDHMAPEALYITPDQNWSRAHRDKAVAPQKVFRRKAAAVLTGTIPHQLQSKQQFIINKNTFTALLKMALRNRASFSGTVIGITGSVGKTTTAAMLRHILNSMAPTYQNSLRFNHETGVPLSIASIPPDYRYAIIEMGMGRPLTILPKSSLARPHIAIIVDIQPDHMAFHDSIFSIVETKMGIADAIEPGGALILNRDSRYFPAMLGLAQGKNVAKIITFGEHPLADVRAQSIILHPSGSEVEIEIGEVPYRYYLGLPGKHMVVNSLAVCATLGALGIGVEEAVDQFPTFRPASGRNELFQAKLDNGASITVINDSFNANPASMRASLHTLALTVPSQGGRRTMVIGDMEELGSTSKEYHEALAEPIIDSGMVILFTIGKLTQHLIPLLTGRIQHHHCSSGEQLIENLKQLLRNGDVLAIKGSARDETLKKLVRYLKTSD